MSKRYRIWTETYLLYNVRPGESADTEIGSSQAEADAASGNWTGLSVLGERAEQAAVLSVEQDIYSRGNI